MTFMLTRGQMFKLSFVLPSDSGSGKKTISEETSPPSVWVAAMNYQGCPKIKKVPF